jgi:tight adherence protein C
MLILLVIIYVFIATGTFLIVRSIMEQQVEKRELYARMPIEKPRIKVTALLGFLKPLFLLSRFILYKLRLYESIRQRIAASHAKLKPEEFFTIKIILIPALLGLIYVVFGKINSIRLLISMFLAYFLPDIWLYSKIKKRKEAIIRLLPETVDLMGLCIEAGLDFTTAARWIIEKTRSNPLIEELSFVIEEIRWGKPRIQALKDMAKRLRIIEVSSFVQSLVQSERMGTPIAEAFSIISEDARLQRFQKGERIALQAPIKILLPLMFFILPVIGIIIMGPVFLQFLSQKSSLASF